MKNIKLSIISLCFLFLACNSVETESSFPVINLGTAVRQEIKLSEIADDVSYIRLDTTRLLSGYGTFLFADSLLFVDTTNYGVLKYTSKGNFLQQIGGIGQGPAEYGQSIRTAIDLENRQLFVFDEPGIILTFSFDGELLGRTKTECTDNLGLFMPFGFNYHQGYFYLFYLIHQDAGYENYCWVILNKEGKIISSKKFEHQIAFNNPVGGTHVQQFTYQYRRSPIYWNQYNDTVFVFNNNNPEPAYLWADGDFRLTPAHDNNNTASKCFVLQNVLDTEKYLFVRYKTNKGYRTLLYDKQKDSSVYSDNLTDDINGGLTGTLHSCLLIDGEEYIFGVSRAHKLKEALLESATPRSMALAETIDEDDNHIIIAIRLKK